MFTKAGALKYDPQLIKPPQGYRGADSMDYANATTTPKDASDAVDVANVEVAKA